MNRRYFLHYSSMTAAYLLTGCEKKSGLDKETTEKTAAIPPTIEKSSLKEPIKTIKPFTQKLKIPGEINFSQINQAEFIAQKSQVNIFPDIKTDVLTFQGDLPNPTVRISKGDNFDLDFINNLSDSTIIHWHGLVVPEEMDGHPKDAIDTGQTKHYHYAVNQSAGTFWYHTHPHGRTGKEIYYGLSGLYIIEDEEEKNLTFPVVSLKFL